VLRTTGAPQKWQKESKRVLSLLLPPLVVDIFCNWISNRPHYKAGGAGKDGTEITTPRQIHIHIHIHIGVHQWHPLACCAVFPRTRKLSFCTICLKHQRPGAKFS